MSLPYSILCDLGLVLPHNCGNVFAFNVEDICSFPGLAMALLLLNNLCNAEWIKFDWSSIKVRQVGTTIKTQWCICWPKALQRKKKTQEIQIMQETRTLKQTVAYKHREQLMKENGVRLEDISQLAALVGTCLVASSTGCVLHDVVFSERKLVLRTVLQIHDKRTLQKWFFNTPWLFSENVGRTLAERYEKVVEKIHCLTVFWKNPLHSKICV